MCQPCVSACKPTHLVAPCAGKDVVQLHVDGTEWQETGHDHLWDGCAVPRKLGDFAWVLVGTAGGEEF